MKKERALELLGTFPEPSEAVLKKMHKKMPQYIFFSKKRQTAHCTACESELPFKDTYEHKLHVQCPNCRARAELVNEKYAGRFNTSLPRSSNNFVVFLHKDKRLYLRCYMVNRYFETSGDDIRGRFENIELQKYIFCDEGSARYGVKDVYEWSYHEKYATCRKHVAAGEWVVRTKMREPVFSQGSYYGTDNSYYPINMHCIKYTNLKHSELENYPDTKLIDYLSFYRKHPGAERLIKCGFGYIVSDIVDHNRAYDIDWKSSELKDMLRLNQAELRALRNSKVSYYSYTSIREKYSELSMDELIQFAPILIYDYGGLGSIKKDTGLSTRKICKYLTKQQCSLRDWSDYLRECKELNYDLSDARVFMPRVLKIAHQRTIDILAALREEQQRKQDAAQRKRNNRELKQRLAERAKLEYQNEKYIVLQPKNIQEIVTEGSKLSHCVGGYAERHANGKLHIMFLRKKDEPTVPFYTIEVNLEGKLVQCRGYRNNWDKKHEKTKDIILFEKEYQKHLDKVFNKKKTKTKVRATA